tara:strand:- start:684 stop:1448 length:765 start_codon:yes stop_codon:yes gene_type:complete
MNRLITFLIFALVTSGDIFAADLTSDQEVALSQATQIGDLDTVIDLTEGITQDSKWNRARGGAFHQRGEERFFQADIEGSIKDFDSFLEIFPSQDAHHWQRGLSYYYAEEYEKGVAQFERHQDVNSQDVENAVWHFLCVVRAPGGDVEKARENFIPIEFDSRIPMKEVHDLFGGRGSEAEVLEAAKSDHDGELSERERNHLCYAHLYLGLYFEALGESKKSVKHIRLAAFDYSMDHYMGKTAQVHAQLRGIGSE